MSIALITVPFASTGLPAGEARGPDALRSAGLVKALGSSSQAVSDLGDVAFNHQVSDRDPVSGIIAPVALAEMVHGTQRAVARALEQRHLPVVVGGECPLLLGCLAAAKDLLAQVGLVFIDGHEDAWPPHSSTTGEAADMELGLALGNTHLTGVPELDTLLPLVNPENLVLLGPRDLQEISDSGLESLKGTVRLFDDVDLRHGDIPALGQRAAEHASVSNGRWWLHLDFDVLSTTALSAVRYPQAGGLNWDELMQLTLAAMSVPGLVGCDLTIYNPDLDLHGAGAARIVEFVAAISPFLPEWS